MEKVRLDRYLAKVLGVPRAQIAHLIDKKMVLVNGVVAKKSEIIEESDKVEIAESDNSVLGMQFRTCGKNLDSAESQNLGENLPIHCHSERSEESQKKNNRDSSPTAQNDNFKDFAESSVDSTNQAQQTIEGIAVEVVGFLDDFGRKARLKSAQCPKSSKSTQDAPKSKLPQEEFALHIQRIYEDDDILVLNKPPFLATHGAPSLKEPSLVEWLKAHKIQRSTISGELREGIVHRLDKQTSGALVVAKNNDAHNALSAQLADKTMGRLYLAIIDLPLKEDIEIECYLARNPKNRLKISKVDMRKYKKFAESSLDFTQNLPKFARYSKSKFYKLLPSKDGKKELILAKLFTGRTHQIRAHLESINRHIVGDELYGYKRGKGEGERVMLHAYLLELAHPKGIKFAESRVGNSSLGLHSADLVNFGRCADFSLALRPKFTKNHESQTENPSVVDSALAQNLGENLPIHCHSERSEESQKKNNRDSSPTAQNDNFKDFAESSVDSTILSQNGLQETSHSLVLPRSHTLVRNDDSAKLRFIAPLFDDMKDYLAKNFDMEKVYEILHGLPARAF